MKKPKVSREEKMSLIQEKLETGVREIFESEKYQEYIRTMAKFPNYSINNCILIASQCPHASYVCGYKKWNEFNRNVVKGESGIMIFAPIKGKVEVEEPKFDERNQPVLNDDGTQSTERVTREYKSFRPCYVFDLSQTEGDPLPSLTTRLEAGVEDYEKVIEEPSHNAAQSVNGSILGKRLEIHSTSLQKKRSAAPYARCRLKGS